MISRFRTRLAALIAPTPTGPVHIWVHAQPSAADTDAAVKRAVSAAATRRFTAPSATVNREGKHPTGQGGSRGE